MSEPIAIMRKHCFATTAELQAEDIDKILEFIATKGINGGKFHGVAHYGVIGEVPLEDLSIDTLKKAGETK